MKVVYFIFVALSVWAQSSRADVPGAKAAAHKMKLGFYTEIQSQIGDFVLLGLDSFDEDEKAPHLQKFVLINRKQVSRSEYEKLLSALQVEFTIDPQLLEPLSENDWSEFNREAVLNPAVKQGQVFQLIRKDKPIYVLVERKKVPSGFADEKPQFTFVTIGKLCNERMQ